MIILVTLIATIVASSGFGGWLSCRRDRLAARSALDIVAQAHGVTIVNRRS